MNGTGPDGHGLKTGRGLGNCSGNSKESSKNQLGRGLGKRRHAAENIKEKRTWLRRLFK
jgi:hypothetical protein